MCQGVIASLVQWQGKNRKVKRCILSGVGSHSELIADNQAKLERLGWRDDAPKQRVYSIESDFSAWNKFIPAGGNPGKSELAILKREYEKCAGSAEALIAHVKRCGKIDYALVALFTAPALAEYDKVKAPALAEYNKVTAPALAEYDKVRAQAWAEYEKVTAPAWAEYKKVTAPAWCKLFAKKSNRVQCLQ